MMTVNLGIPLVQVCLYEDNDDDEIDEEQKKTRLRIMKYLIQKAVLYDASHAAIGGLFYKNHYGLLLDFIVEKYGAEDTWSCIKRALSSFPNIPILHEIIRHSPQNFQNAITQFPNSVLLRDSQNRLPIHVALECGMEWGPELVSIMNSNREHLKEVDPVTKWPPFVLAALDESSPSCNLSMILFLLREHPQHVQVFLSGRRKKNKKRRK